MNTIVFDIETQNFFTDPGVGWDNFAALKISAVGVYSYTKDEYVCFEEGEMEQAAELFRRRRVTEVMILILPIVLFRDYANTNRVRSIIAVR